MTASSGSAVDPRELIFEQLSALKRAQPELEAILDAFKVDQAVYDREMLSILAEQSQICASASTGEEFVSSA